MTEQDYEARYEPQTPAERAAELLALATVFEIPRPDNSLPVQLRRSYGHTDRWSICDGMYGRRWHREHGWVYEAQGIRDEAQRDNTRFTLAEAVPLARRLADPSGAAVEAPPAPAAVDRCTCRAAVHNQHHKTAPVPGCPWCAT